MTRPTLKSTGLVTALTLAVSLGAMTAAQAGPYIASVTSGSQKYGNSDLASLGYSTSSGLVTTANIGVVTGERASFTSPSGYTKSGEYAGTYKNSNGTVARSPYQSATTTTSGGTTVYPNYLAAEVPSTTTPPSSVTLTFAKAQNGFDLLWGSIGAKNTLTFYSGTNGGGIVMGSINGQDVHNFDTNLNLTNAPSAYVSIGSTHSFSSIVATVQSSNPAFEFVPGADLHTVPEPGSLALLGTALLGLAGILRFRRRA